MLMLTAHHICCAVVPCKRMRAVDHLTTHPRASQVLVVANPANTNALILKENAPSIPPENITCLTRLDHNRALGQVDLSVELCHTLKRWPCLEVRVS